MIKLFFILFQLMVIHQLPQSSTILPRLEYFLEQRPRIPRRNQRLANLLSNLKIINRSN